VVGPSEAGDRIDRAVASLTSLSRREIRRLLGEGVVWRNGQALRVQSRVVELGDVIDVLCPPEEVGPVAGSAPEAPLVLHDDGWLLAAAKPAGVLSQPDERDRRALSFDRQVLVWLAWSEGQRPFLRLVHRLDRVTSGVLLFARSPAALSPLTAAWRDGRVGRWYIAVVDGDPEPTRVTIDRPIARDPSHRWRFRVADSGRPARTAIRLLPAAASGRSIAVCRLETGRTHQVRVHLASIGHPVVGDRLYGGSAPPEVDRPLLHAAVLELPHPRDGRKLVVEATLPEDIRIHVDPRSARDLHVDEPPV
jgi:RluA family pseudouridine synthase